MRVFVVGSQGQVARSLQETAARSNDIVLRCAGRAELDLLRPASLAEAMADFRPDIVINPAAYTAVDKAESEPELAFAINRDGAGAVASAAAGQGAPVIHFSTDYVFDGSKPDPYVESDPVNPQTVYGHSKLEGEVAVAAANPRHIVLRTSWVYSPFGTNFVQTMLRVATERTELRVVDDQVGCPTYAPDIAAVTIAIARTVLTEGWHSCFGGTTHLAGPDPRSWCSFARAIMDDGAMRGARVVPVVPIRTADYPTAAMRPQNSRLSTERLRSVFDLRLPRLKHSLANCLDRLLKI